MPPVNKAIISALLVGSAATASADPTAGVDSELFRLSYDNSGIFSLEGARLIGVCMPVAYAGDVVG